MRLIVTTSLVALAAIASSLAAQDQEAIDQQLAAMRADLAELRAQGDGHAPWLTRQRAEEVRALVRDVLADAESRVSLQEVGLTGGWKDSFYIGSDDGNWKLKIGGYTQVRYSYDHRSSNPANPGESVDTWGAAIRRLKLYFDGHIIDPSWRYKIEFASNQGAAFALEDTWIEKQMADGLVLKTGQFKSPFLRETLLSDTVTMLVDRSSIESFFGAGRSAGLQLSWETEQLRVTGGYFNGFEVKSNYFNSGSMRNLAWDSTKIAEYAFVSRLEWKPSGGWAQFKDPSSWVKDGPGLLVGVAAEVEKKENTQGCAAGAENPFVVAATADVSIEFAGGSLMSYFVWRQVEPTAAGLEVANQFGVVVQGGVFISDTLELTARYEYGDADTMPNGGAPNPNPAVMDNNGYSIFNAVGLGANWYISGQRVKLSADINYAFNGVGAFTSSANDFLVDGTSATGQFDQSGQVLARVQLQLIW